MAAISNNLLNNDRFYQKILDTLPVLLFWTDTENTILGNNLPHAKAFGFSSPDELVGKSLKYFFEHSPVFTPALIKRIKKEHQEIIQTKKGKTLEYTAVMADHKEHTHLSHKEPLFDEKGRVVGLVGISTDITELKCTQVQLQQAKQTAKNIFQKIIDSIPVLLFWTNKNHMIIGNNLPHAHAFGFSKSDDMLGKNMDTFSKHVGLSNETIKIVHKEHDEIMSTKKGKVSEYKATLSDKKEKTWLSYKEPLLNTKNEAIGVIGISMDITELKETQKKLEKSNAVKQEFIANMSHDMRTPITGIMGMLIDLLDCTAEIEVTRDTENQLGINHTNEFLEALLRKVENNSHVALGAVDGLLHLCNEILETVRLESHTAKMPLEAFELNAVIDAVMNLVKPTATEKKLTLSEKIDNQIPQYLFGSARYLSKSLLNLISNALKFTEKGSITVLIKLADSAKEKFRKGDKITLNICITDTGIGIPKDKFKTIFEHFSKLNPSYKGTYKGYGLGLYTVKQYVEEMSGTINLESMLGKGTQFILTLPFTVDDHTDHIKPEIDQPIHLKTQPNVSVQTFDEAQAHDNTRVLLVEDTEMAATVARNMLKKCGCRSVIDWAQTGEIGLKKATENNYDLILMDIGLPKMQGTEVTEKIRALDDPIKSKVPIVALTGHADREHKKAFQALGMNDLIIKPATDPNITRVLNAYVFPKSNVIKKDETRKATATPLVFDWEASLKLDSVKNDENLLNEYLSLLSGELKPTKKILIKAYKNKDEKTLRAELHRVRGALTYLVAPELNHTLKEFHQAVKAMPQNPQTLEETYQAAIKAIDHFQQAYANGLKSAQE